MHFKVTAIPGNIAGDTLQVIENETISRRFLVLGT
jgi:hypothetical protein